MIRKTPAFWYDTETTRSRSIAAALSSISALYTLGHLAHQNLIRAHKAEIPIICIGNLVAGGSGKTPTALALMELIRKAFPSQAPCFLSRGYGGTLPGPARVDPSLHSAADIGDEALLLAAKAPTVVSADRVAGSRFAKEQGYDLVLMDDGLQNPALEKTLSIVVIDGATGFGNGLLLPAGPLRTPLNRGLRKADAILLIGEDRNNVLRHVPEGKTILRAALQARPPENPAERYVAFCGIAHPEKFRRSLEKEGISLVGFESFPDHHPYNENEIKRLKALAEMQNARLITTAKDAVRLPASFIAPESFDTLAVTLILDKSAETKIKQMIEAALVQ